MPNYLTPTRYRSMGMGASLADKTDSDLATLIAGASALANSYCCVPVGHDFRGGTITDETHEWDPGSARELGTYRVWPFHRPVKAASALSIEITNNQRLTFEDPTSLYVEPVEGYVEPVDLALTAFGVFGYGVLPNIGLRKPVAKLSYTYGWSLEAEDTITTSLSDASLQLQNQFLTDDEIAATKNGSPFLNFSVDRDEGLIALDTPADAADVFTFGYRHKLPPALPLATAILVTELLGVSKIQAAGLAGLSGIKVKEVELRQSKASFLGTGMSPLASALLAPYVIRSIA